MIALFSMLRRFLRRIFLPGILIFLFAMAFSPLPRTAPTIRNHDTGQSFLPDYGHPLVAAHRIGKGDAPENTLMAVRTCLESENSPDIIETDLQCTKDGELVLFHDLYLDEKTDSVEVFGKENVPVFSKTYDELHELNMGESFEVSAGSDVETTYPYAGLRGDDIPDDLRIVKIEDVFDYVQAQSPDRFFFTVEIKYPFPWAPKMIDKLYTILHERSLEDRVIVASYWPDVSAYIDLRYSGKLMRSANPLEIVDLYACFERGTDLSGEKIPFMALQMPYYYTVNRADDMQDLIRGGADVLMTDHPDRAQNAIRNTELFEEEKS